MMFHVPIAGLPALVNGQIVEVVIEEAFLVTALKFTDPDATAIDHRRLAFAQVAVLLGQNGLVQRLRFGEVQEPFAQILVELQNLGIERQENSGVVLLCPDLALFHDLDFDTRPITLLTDRAVDGVADELTEGQGHFVPVLLAVIEDEAQVFSAGTACSCQLIGAAVLHDDTTEFLACLIVGNRLRPGGELHLERSGEHDGSKLIAEADSNTMFAAGPESSDDAFVGAGISKADAQDGESFWRANTDVFNLEIRWHD